MVVLTGITVAKIKAYIQHPLAKFNPCSIEIKEIAVRQSNSGKQVVCMNPNDADGGFEAGERQFVRAMSMGGLTLPTTDGEEIDVEQCVGFVFKREKDSNGIMDATLVPSSNPLASLTPDQKDMYEFHVSKGKTPEQALTLAKA